VIESGVAPRPLGRVPVFFCIDLEPIERLVGGSDPGRWLGVDFLSDYLDRLRPRLADVSGDEVRFLWFVRCDPQIETAFGSADDLLRSRSELLDRLVSKGDRIGVHVHSWRWDDDVADWVADFGDSAWIERCVRTAFEAYQTHFGVPCQLHRFGDRWFGAELVPLLKELGARYDLTIEPGARGTTPLAAGERMTGAIPDYTRAPRSPYRPSPTDFLLPDPVADSTFWMIPLSAANPSPALPILWRIGRKARFPLHTPHRPLPLHRPWRSAHAYWNLVQHHVESLDRPYLAFAIRSGDPEGAEARLVRAALEHLLGHPLVQRLRFSDPARELGEPGSGSSLEG
jgi:hypothetical protein